MGQYLTKLLGKTRGELSFKEKQFMCWWLLRFWADRPLGSDLAGVVGGALRSVESGALDAPSRVNEAVRALLGHDMTTLSNLEGKMTEKVTVPQLKRQQVEMMGILANEALELGFRVEIARLKTLQIWRQIHSIEPLGANVIEAIEVAIEGVESGNSESKRLVEAALCLLPRTEVL